MNALNQRGYTKMMAGMLIVALVVLVVAAGAPVFAHAQSTTATTGTPAASASANVATPTDCTPSMYNLSAIFSVVCWGRTIGAIVDGILVSISSWILTLSGNLFNWLLNYTVIQFGGPLYQSIQGAIETAWTAFRDIANIMIIGIFTFIAISIIAGLQQFGNKRLIAELLIVAILINFSLLFTKIIIDGSNYTALQIYAASTGQTAAGASATASNASFSCPQGATNSQCYGIAGSFMDYMGVSGFSDTRQAVSNLADSLDNGVIAFIHGLFAAVLLLAAALVLFYGSFLLISRALLLIFLLVTSSIAVASYLIPAWKNARFGWDKWWASLWRCAVFAPLIMLLLWIDLTVSYALKAHNGTLGDLIAHPTSTPDLSSLASYCLILGLLFFSFKIANVFATEKTPWFGYAFNAAVSPITQGSRYLAGPIGRQLLGRWAAGREDTSMSSAKQARLDAKRARDSAEVHQKAGNFALANFARKEARNLDKLAATSLRSAGRYGAIAAGRINPMDTNVAKSIAKAVGVEGFAAGQTAKDKKGYSGQIDERVKNAAKLAEKLAPSAEDNQKERERAEERYKEQRKLGRQQFEEQKHLIEQKADEERGALQQQHNLAVQSQRTAETAARSVEAQHEDTIRSIREDLRKAATPDETVKHQGRLSAAESERDSVMREQKRNIEQAQAAVAEKLSQINNLAAKQFDLTDSAGNQFKKSLNEVGEDIKEHDKETQKNVKEEGKRAVDALAKSMAETAAEIGRRSDPIFDRIIGGALGDNKRVAEGVQKKYKGKRSSTARLASAVRETNEEESPPAQQPT